MLEESGLSIVRMHMRALEEQVIKASLLAATLIVGGASMVMAQGAGDGAGGGADSDVSTPRRGTTPDGTMKRGEQSPGASPGLCFV